MAFLPLNPHQTPEFNINEHYDIYTGVIDSLITDNYLLFLQLNNQTTRKKKTNIISYKYVDNNEMSLILNKTD